MLLLNDGICRGVIEPLTPDRRVIVAIEPICNLLIVPPFRKKPAYRVIQELLILGIECYPEMGKTNFYGEGKKDVGSVRLGD